MWVVVVGACVRASGPGAPGPRRGSGPTRTGKGGYERGEPRDTEDNEQANGAASLGARGSPKPAKSLTLLPYCPIRELLQTRLVSPTPALTVPEGASGVVPRLLRGGLARVLRLHGAPAP